MLKSSNNWESNLTYFGCNCYNKLNLKLKDWNLIYFTYRVTRQYHTLTMYYNKKYIYYQTTPYKYVVGPSSN